MEIFMTYSAAIKKLRNKMLLTQTELADFLGVKFGTVNRWEAGLYEPTMKNKRKLAKLFKEYDIVVEGE